MIDQTVKSVAQNELSARRLLFTEGPFGLGLQFVPGTENKIEVSGGTGISFAKATPLVFLSDTFTIPAREIEAHQNTGINLNLHALITKIIGITAKEDKLIYYGENSAGLTGLTNSNGVQHFQINPWEQVGDAVESVLKGVELLDKVGFHGPYSLALCSSLYNKLFRRYPQTEIIEMDHLKKIVTDGIIKAPALHSGGVLTASGKKYASIVLGQDLMAGFEGPSQRDYIFTVSETVALRLIVPESVCILQE